MKKELLGIMLTTVAILVGIHAVGTVEDSGAALDTLAGITIMAVLAIAAKQCFDHEDEH